MSDHTDEWAFKIEPTPYTLPYEVTVYRNGVKVAADYAASLRGARRTAKRLKRRVIRRQHDTTETGSL